MRVMECSARGCEMKSSKMEVKPGSHLTKCCAKTLLIYAHILVMIQTLYAENECQTRHFNFLKFHGCFVHTHPIDAHLQ